MFLTAYVPVVVQTVLSCIFKLHGLAMCVWRPFTCYIKLYIYL